MAHIENLTNDDYHARPELSASMMQTFRERGPQFYESRYLTKTIAGTASTPAMDLGTATHCLTLEPGKFAETVALAPEVNRKTNDGKAVWAAFHERHKGFAILTHDQLETCKAMATAIKSHPVVRKLLSRDGKPEESIFWRDPATGLECKCRVDWHDSICLDLKTSRSVTPAAFRKQAANLGYHRARVHYLDGIEALTGERPPLLHVVVSNEPPHEVCVVNLVQFDKIARPQVDWTRDRIAHRMERNDWLAEWQQHVVEIDPPTWAEFETVNE